MAETEKLVPKRRFKEFANCGAWERRKLEDVVEFLDTMRKPLEGAKRSFGPYPYYGASGIVDYVDGYLFDEELVLLSEDGANITDRNYPVCFLVSGKYWVNNHAHVLKTKEGNENNFICNSLERKDFKQYNSGMAMPKLNQEVCRGIPISCPCYTEQKQIGDYFRNLDNVITLHQRKVKKIKALKSAYLSEMFPAEGECRPKRRFTGFTEGWEQRKAKELCSISTGKSNTQDRVEDGKYPFYVRSPIVEKSNRYLFDEEAVLTVGDGVGTGKVFHYVNGKYDLHQRVYRMFGFSEEITAKYFYYYFSNHFYDRVMAMTAKTSVDSVRYEMIAEMEISLPNKQEQTCILLFFEQLDRLITLHQQKLEKLQNIKKAFLNEMFI